MMETSKKQTNIIKERKINRGEGRDAKKVSSRLQFFKQEESPAFKAISKLFYSGIVHSELKRIAEILSLNLNLYLDRDAKRDNRVLIKWFDENWQILHTEIDKIKLYDSNCNLISL